VIPITIGKLSKVLWPWLVGNRPRTVNRQMRKVGVKRVWYHMPWNTAKVVTFKFLIYL
jgi:hypothetical protein